MRMSDTSDLWWKTAVIYCLDVQTFLDWNDDGCGDFPGLAQHAAWIEEYASLGFDEIYLHQVGVEQRGFLDAFGEHVLPQLDVEKPDPAVAL